MDWDSWTYTGALDGYFRAYTVNLGAGTQSPMADRSANFTSPSGCRYMELRIRDPVTGALQDAIAYIHTWTNSPGTSFTIASGWSQNYFTTMRADGGNCPWTGYHIHELSNWPYSILNGDIRFNGGVFGNYCIPYANHDPVNDTCLKLKNNDLANWSRYYDW
ncbi:MAG TPA: hypothetical protein VFP63_01935 [Dehalococcoidia bacterium]|nr:hypothetical protein [Dehalococcoidia bacterium]